MDWGGNEDHAVPSSRKKEMDIADDPLDHHHDRLYRLL